MQYLMLQFVRFSLIAMFFFLKQQGKAFVSRPLFIRLVRNPVGVLYAESSSSKTVSQVLSQIASFSSNSTVVPVSRAGIGFKKPGSDVNLKGLKAEVSRAILRIFKKVGKANERLARAEKEYMEIMAMDAPPQEELESCPDPDEFKQQLSELQRNLNQARDLEEALKDIKSTSDEKFASLFEIATSLNIGDSPPPAPERGPKKPKGKTPSPRMPYHIHTSLDGIEIRVGRGASENDELSCNFEHRDASDWWLHVAGFPGSHVIIRSGHDDLPEKFPESLKDAAILAAVNSKAAQAGRVQVSYCRARNVSKPPGAKPGMVRLSGDISTITLDMKAERRRFARLSGETLEEK